MGETSTDPDFTLAKEFGTPSVVDVLEPGAGSPASGSSVPSGGRVPHQEILQSSVREIPVTCLKKLVGWSYER